MSGAKAEGVSWLGVGGVRYKRLQQLLRLRGNKRKMRAVVLNYSTPFAAGAAAVCVVFRSAICTLC